MRRAAGWTVFGLILLALILIPFFGFQAPIAAGAESFLRSRPSGWIAGPAITLLLASDLLLPIPSSLVSTTAGLLLGLWAGALASFTGMTLGCLAGYAIGARAGRGVARRLVGPAELDRVARASERFGVWMIVLFRAVPVLAEASVVFAGTIRMPMRSFLAPAALSNLGISVAYAGVGAYSANVASFLVALAGAVALPAAAMLVSRWISALPRGKDGNIR